MLNYAKSSILYDLNLDWWTTDSYLVQENRRFKEKIGDKNIRKLEKKLKVKIKNIINTRQLSAEPGWTKILKYEMILEPKVERLGK